MVRTSAVWPEANLDVVSCQLQADQVAAPMQQTESAPVDNTRFRSANSFGNDNFVCDNPL
jgi:hypothetical protein